MERGNKRDFWLAALALFVVYMLPMSYTIFGLILRQNSFINNYHSQIFASVMLLMLIIYFLMSSFRIRKKEALILCFLGYIIMNIIITSRINNGISSVALDSLLDFGVKVIPAVITAFIVSKRRLLHQLIQWVDIFVLIGTVGLLFPLYKMAFDGLGRVALFDTFAVDYQMISYYAFYFFALNSFMIFVGKRHLDNKSHSLLSYQVFRIVSAIIQMLASLISGGRGGFIAILTILFFWLVLFTIKRKKYIRLILYFVLFVAVFIVLSRSELFTALFGQGINRVFSFVGQGGIDWSGTSGRDVIYSKVFSLISQNPVWGCGITGGSYHNVISAHNFFFEILIEGGILYLIFWDFILVVFFRKITKKINWNDEYLLILMIFFSDFIGLMFSFIYLRCTAFWFAIFFLFTDDSDKDLSIYG